VWYLHNIGPVRCGHEEERQVVLGRKLEVLASHLRQAKASLRYRQQVVPHMPAAATYIVVDVYFVGYQNTGYGWAILS
jgi:hypothetical protein